MSGEQQLEQVVRSIRELEMAKAPPIFELYSSLVAISISILLFLLKGVFFQEATFYVLMRAVMPQYGWALLFFAAGVLSAVGMLIDNDGLRIFALALMVASFGMVAAFYILTFPNMAGVLMFWLTIFSGVSIPMVKHTGIRKQKQCVPRETFERG